MCAFAKRAGERGGGGDWRVRKYVYLCRKRCCAHIDMQEVLFEMIQSKSFVQICTYTGITSKKGKFFGVKSLYAKCARLLLIPAKFRNHTISVTFPCIFFFAKLSEN